MLGQPNFLCCLQASLQLVSGHSLAAFKFRQPTRDFFLDHFLLQRQPRLLGILSLERVMDNLIDVREVAALQPLDRKSVV